MISILPNLSRCGGLSSQTPYQPFAAAILLNYNNNYVGGPLSLTLTLGGVRLAHSKRVNVKVQRLVPGGVRYPGFTYFPRSPDEKDPPYEPTKLFAIRRTRASLKGLPWWEIDNLNKLGIGKVVDKKFATKNSKTVIVKNTPANNTLLYKVKHLIEVIPIKTPYGMPEDPNNGFLKENGEFISYNCLQGHQLQLAEAEEQIKELKERSVDPATLKSRLRTKWYSRF